MELIKMIIAATNRYDDKLSEIIKFDGIVGIYGAGVMGKGIGNILRKVETYPDYYVVDLNYWKQGQFIELGIRRIPVISIDEFNRIADEKILINAIELHSDDFDIKLAELSNLFSNCTIVDFEHIWYGNLSAITYSYFWNNYRAFLQTYNLLEDELSRETFVEYVNANICGDATRLNKLCEKASSWMDYSYDLLGIASSQGAVIECGAYDGKTTKQLSKIKTSDYIYALEPDHDNFEKLITNVCCCQNVKAMNIGTLDCDGEVFFQEGNESTSSVVLNCDGDECIKISVKSIDTIAKHIRVASIVMDIEGSELATLEGAKGTIIRDHPTLGIRIYHKKEDLILIPRFIMSLDKKYRLYLRKNTTNRGYMETTLYAI